MDDLYKLEDEQGALFVTANVLGQKKIAQYQAKWHTKELRPKFDTMGASATSTAVTATVSNGTYFQTDDLVLVPSTKELVMVTGVTGNTLGIARSWGATAAADIANSADLLILGPHYAENAQLRAGRTVTEVLYTNDVALFRHNFEISGTLQAVSEGGGTYHGSVVDDERQDMLLTHKRDINLSAIFSEAGSSGNQRSMSGFVEFVTLNGTSRTNNTSAVTFSVFSTAMRTAMRYNTKKMLFIVSTLGAQIVSEWALANNAHIMLDPGAKLFGLAIMDVVTPHGKVRLIVDDALEGTYGSRYWLGVSTDKKGGPKWGHLRNTSVKKNRQETDQDGYEEEVLTEGTIIWGNPNYHYLFNNAQTSS
jgi:hypothetical protein